MRRGFHPPRLCRRLATPMRVAVFGDVHGNLAALEAVLDAMDAQRVDARLCTGDLVNYGPEPVAVLKRVLAVAPACVAGNHDRLLARWREGALDPRPGRDMRQEEDCLRWTAARLGPPERECLGALPDRLQWPPPAPRVLLAHGSPLSADEYVLPDLTDGRWDEIAREPRRLGASVVVLGHTHLPMCRAWGGLLFCNPGSVGWPKDGDPRAAFGLLEFEPASRRAPRFSICRVDYDAAAVAAAMIRAGLPAAVAAAVRAGRPAGGASG